jgi:hypothetical protein
VSNPHTAVPPDERVGSPHKPTQSPLSTREPIGATPDQSEATDSRNEILDLIYHPSDFQITQIVDNSKVCVWKFRDIIFLIQCTVYTRI